MTVSRLFSLLVKVALIATAAFFDPVAVRVLIGDCTWSEPTAEVSVAGPADHGARVVRLRVGDGEELPVHGGLGTADRDEGQRCAGAGSGEHGDGTTYESGCGHGKQVPLSEWVHGTHSR